MAYDGARHVIVMFGGRSGSTLLGDTWTWDGANWTQLHPGVVASGGWVQRDRVRRRTRAHRPVRGGRRHHVVVGRRGLNARVDAVIARPADRSLGDLRPRGEGRGALRWAPAERRAPRRHMVLERSDVVDDNDQVRAATRTRRALMSYDPALHRPVLFGAGHEQPVQSVLALVGHVVPRHRKRHLDPAAARVDPVTAAQRHHAGERPGQPSPRDVRRLRLRPPSRRHVGLRKLGHGVPERRVDRRG